MIADVGEVERRPVRQVDEVGDRVGADPIGEVADRPAGEQPGGDPHPGPGRVAGEEVGDHAERRQR